jgi:hypothetical protein
MMAPHESLDRVALRADGEITGRRARLASAALIVAGGFSVLWRGLALVAPASAPGEPPLVQPSRLVFTFTMVSSGTAAIILYGRWLYRAYSDNRALGGAPLALTPRAAIASFFIPIVNVYGPYAALRDLHAASDPTPLTDVPQYKPAPTPGDYRSADREELAPPRWELPFPVAAWWASFMLGPLVLWGSQAVGVVGERAADAVGLLLTGAATVFGVQVVRSIAARQSERLRRLELAGGLSTGGSAEGREVDVPFSRAAQTCPRCHADAHPQPASQTCPRCGLAFVLYAGAALDRTVVVPPFDRARSKLLVRSSGLLFRRVSALTASHVSTGVPNPVLAADALDRNLVAFKDIETITFWRAIDRPRLAIALGGALPLSVLGLLGELHRHGLDDHSGSAFGKTWLVTLAIAAWLLYVAVVRKRFLARVVGRGVELVLRYDTPFRGRTELRDELLRRAGVVAGG